MEVPFVKHKGVLATTLEGESTPIDKYSFEYYAARPEDHQVIDDLNPVTPDALDLEIMKLHRIARQALRDENGFVAVQAWRKAPHQFYRLDILGIIGLSITRDSSLIGESQRLIENVRRHREGNPDSELTPLVSPMESVHFSLTLSVVAFNHAEWLWQAGRYEEALESLENSLEELPVDSATNRRLDRLTCKAFLLDKLGEVELAQASIDEARITDPANADACLQKWAPQLPELLKYMEKK